jgi:hypothetical protein
VCLRWPGSEKAEDFVGEPVVAGVRHAFIWADEHHTTKRDQYPQLQRRDAALSTPMLQRNNTEPGLKPVQSDSFLSVPRATKSTADRALKSWLVAALPMTALIRIALVAGIVWMTCLICSSVGTRPSRRALAIRVSLTDRLKYSASEYEIRDLYPG